MPGRFDGTPVVLVAVIMFVHAHIMMGSLHPPHYTKGESDIYIETLEQD